MQRLRAEQSPGALHWFPIVAYSATGGEGDAQPPKMPKLPKGADFNASLRKPAALETLRAQLGCWLAAPG